MRTADTHHVATTQPHPRATCPRLLARGPRRSHRAKSSPVRAELAISVSIAALHVVHDVPQLCTRHSTFAARLAPVVQQPGARTPLHRAQRVRNTSSIASDETARMHDARTRPLRDVRQHGQVLCVFFSPSPVPQLCRPLLRRGHGRYRRRKYDQKQEPVDRPHDLTFVLARVCVCVEGGGVQQASGSAIVCTRTRRRAQRKRRPAAQSITHRVAATTSS